MIRPLSEVPPITETKRLRALTRTPQALAWHAGSLWMGSRDLGRIYEIDPTSWSVVKEIEPPGIPWAAVSTGDAIWFTLGEGAEDDRYIHRYDLERGFDGAERIACPEFTGSYLSYDGEHLYLSQWYKHRILQLSRSGEVLRAIDIGAEICGHVFAHGLLYVLRGTEAGEEDWRIARLDPGEANPKVEDLALVPFASRSLAFDGANFWSNHRAADETVSFILPE